MQGTITMLTIYDEEENRTSYTWDDKCNEARLKIKYILLYIDSIVSSYVISLKGNPEIEF